MIDGCRRIEYREENLTGPGYIEDEYRGRVRVVSSVRRRVWATFERGYEYEDVHDSRQVDTHARSIKEVLNSGNC
jgi:hypothetical protein